MNWKNYFSARILQRGYAYYKKGKVKGYVDAEDACMARVLGTHVYRVSITGLHSSHLHMSCSCPYAADGNNCKHMAAVLYQWDATHGASESDGAGIPEEPAPFPDDETHRHLYYNLAHITQNINFSPAALRSARGMLKRGEVTLDSVNLDYRGNYFAAEQVMYCYGHCESPGRNHTNIFLSLDAEHILRATCNMCGRFYDSTFYSSPGAWNTRVTTALCEHEIALLILLDDYLKKYNPGDSTDFAGSRFLDAFRDIRRIDAVEQQGSRAPRIRLEPRVIREPEGLYLSFRIGTGKLYVVKNMTSLVKQESGRESVTLGASCTLHFGEETFTQDSEKYWNFLQKNVHAAEALSERLSQNPDFYGAETIALKNMIPLAGEALDDFYRIAEGSVAEYQDRSDRRSSSRTSSIRIAEQKLRMTVQIRKAEKEDGTFDGVTVSGTVPERFDGNQYSYFLTEDTLSRLDPENQDQLAPFFDASVAGDLNFHIGTKNLGDFYYRILPDLRENDAVTIREPDLDEIETLLPPEASFAFYLDVQDDILVCRAQVAYADDTHPLQPVTEEILPLASYRDPAEEQRAVLRTEQFFPEYSEEEHFFFCKNEDDALYTILDRGVPELLQIGTVSGTDAFRRLKIRKVPSPSIGVSVDSGLMDLDITTPDMSPEELLDLLQSYRQKKRYHRLRGGDFIRIEEDNSLEMLSSLMDNLGISLKDFVHGKMHLPLYRALYLDRMLEEHDEIAASRDRRFRALIKNFKTVKESDYEVPASLAGVMRNYQVYGYKWMRTLADCGFGGILADDMGLGKTLQAISVLLAAKEEGVRGTSLIVCPASLVYNWQEEFQRFAPKLRVTTVSGTLPVRRQILQRMDHYDAMITSYDLLKRDIGRYEDMHFLWQILDEAQYIKNPKAAVSKSVKIIHSTHRMALTGTPIENRLSELWSIFDFLMPGFLYQYATFRQDFEIPVTKEQNPEVTDRLKKMVSPFILRRLKKDVLKDLPEKLEEVRYARFDTEQQKLYDAQVVHMRKELQEPSSEGGKDKIRILAELTRIREICCDPSLIVENYTGPSAKREACLDLIQSAIDGGHKMLVFSQFTSMLELLEQDLQKEKITYYKITGSTRKEDRLSMVHQFNRDDTPVFLISLKAGGTGLNLIGADVVIHYDPWWNLAAQNQATDRTHRIGQTRQVSVYRLIAKNTIEEKILKMQESKKDLADAILSGQQESLASLSSEELLELLS